MTVVDEFGRTRTLSPTSPSLIVEFAGTPKAGKTTALNGLRHWLQDAGCPVEVVEEQAPLSPVPEKRDPDFNVWTVTTTMARMVTAVQADGRVVLVDRGVLDALCWMDWHHQAGQLGRKNRLAFDRFLLTRSRTVDLVLLMTVEPAEAVRRDTTSERSARAIVRPEVLTDFNRSIESVRRRYARRFELVHLDTTRTDQKATLARVVEAVDRVLTAPKGAAILKAAAVHTTRLGPQARSGMTASQAP